MKIFILFLTVFLSISNSLGQIDTCAVAGEDSTIYVCPDEITNLFDGLSGYFDTTGTWYDPVDSVVTDPFNYDPIDIPGQFLYTYVNQHPGCPPDTAVLTMIVESAPCENWGISESGIIGIDIYPNPAHDAITLNNADASLIYQYQIYSLDGSLIDKGKPDDNEIHIAGLEPGIYWLFISDSNRIGTYRIVKI